MKLFTFLSIVLCFFIMSLELSYGANLAIRKSGPSNANPGDLVTYTITYSNTVSTLESNVIITDYLPDQVNGTYHSSSPSGIYNSVTNTITWNSTQIPGLASLDAGSGEHTVQVTVRIGNLGTGINQSTEGYYLNASPATLSTYADIKSDQTPTAVLSDAISTVVAYDCTFKISQPSAGIKSATGSTLTYLVALTNSGNIYQKYSLASTLYSGQNLFQSIQDLSGGTISETPFIAPGSTYLFHYVLTTPAGTKPNEYTETQITAIPNLCGDPQAATYKTFIYGGGYGNYELLSVYKIDTSDPVQAGSQLTYQIVISNVGSSLTDVRLRETYPANTSFVSASTSTSAVTTGNNIWDFSSLPSGNTIVTVTLDVANELPNGILLSNTIEVSSNGIVYDTYTETTTVASAPDLSITKTASVVNSVAGPGSIVNYTLTYINNGNYTASDVVIKDNYDETYMTVGNIGTGIDAGGEITWNIPGALAPGASGSIQYSMSIKNNAVLFLNGSTNIINSAVISSNLTDGNISDNTASATVNVLVLPDLKIEKTADPSIGLVNQPITYTLTVSNIGKLDHAGSTYTVVDYLPAGTTYLSSTPSGGVYSSGTVTWTISDDLAVGDAKNFTVTLDALPCSFVGLGTLTNNASVTSNSYGDADNSNKDVTLVTDVVDNVKPMITFTDPVTVNNDPGQCSADVTLTVPVTDDNCGILSVTKDHASTIFPVGTTKVTWTVTDIHGNVTTAIQNVIVNDLSAPVPDAETLLTITGDCGVTVTAPTATDNCAGTITATTTDPLTYSAQGTYTIDWTYDDGNGNTSTQTQTVEVKDITSPLIPVLADVTVGECSGTPVTPTTTDNCNGTITGTTTTVFPITTQGTTIVTWTFDDGNGNVTTATQNVMVDDVTAPVADVASLPTLTGECGVTVTAPTATDNCKGIVTGTTSDPLTYSAQGTYTINWTYDDGNGNTSTQSQSVVVDDITPPVTPVLADLTMGECSGTPVTPTTTDNCNGTITGTTTTVFPITTQGTTIVTWTFDDGNGNVTTATQNVMVDDITPPVADVASLPTLTGECGVTVTAPTATDNCLGTITAITTDPLTYSMEGSYIIDWTYDDGNGNISSQAQTVIVDDVTAPVADVETLATLTGQYSVTASGPTATDNCEGTITATTTDPLTYSAQGTYTINWTYDDGNGNTSTQSQTVVVDDTTPPVTPVLADVTVGECSGTPTAPTTTDINSEVITGTTTTVFPITTQGTTVVTWTFDDGNGNVTTANQNVIVDDITAPVPDVETLLTLTGECGVTVTAPTATDNCEGTITATTTDPLIYTIQGTYTINWTYDDGNGNTSTQAQIVIVDDVTAPVADVEILATLTNECSVTVTAPTATDNCEGTIVGTTEDELTYSTQGTYTINWVYDDGNGNTSTQSQTVVVDDITPPATLVLADMTLGECSGIPVAPTTTDNCSGVITGTTTTVFPITTKGTTVVTWTFDDGNGNVTIANQNVIVDDITAPIPDVESLATLTNECSVTVTAPTATDNCEGTIVGTTEDELTYSTQGTYTINWTYDDGNGNASTQAQTVIVDDVTAPVADVETLATLTGQYSVTAAVPTATDNCEGIVTGTTTDPLTYTNQGTYTIHWTYDDGNGNTSIQSQTVVVEDTTGPETPVLADVTVGECSGTPTVPTITDINSEVITGTTTTVFPITTQGTTIVTWTFDDGKGNVTTAAQNVMVDDVTAPVADMETLATLTGECGVTVTAPTATDNCKGSVTATTTDPLTYTIQGTYTIHWTYDDGNGNTSTQTQTVVVDDMTPPEKPILADITLGECSGTPPIPTTTDNCKGTVYGTTSILFPKTRQGKHTILWTFDDGNGNVTTAAQNVMVDDVTAPVADVASLPIIAGECGVTVTAPTATDNCVGSITGITTDPLTYSVQGTYSINWIYDDGHGNTSTQSQTVVVEDLTPPEKPILADITLGECSGTPPIPTTTDNCKGTVYGTTSILFPKTRQGKHTILWTFDDGNGNVITAYQNLIVDDETAPVADVASLPIIAGECGVTVTAPTATDNCVGSITATTTDPLTYTIQGTYSINWTYDDGHGNTSTQTQTVVVDDVTAPVADVASLPTLTGECGVAVTAPTANDNCMGPITATTTDPLTYSILGRYTINWTYDDGNGNTSTQSQTVIVDDVTAPEIKGTIASITVEGCRAEDVYPAEKTVEGLETLGLSISDVCTPDAFLTVTSKDVTSESDPTTVTRTYTITDTNNNSSSYIQLIDVVDTQNPSIIGPPDMIVNADAGDCENSGIALGTPITEDNCSISSVINDAPDIFKVGTTIVTWTVTDKSGNTSTWQQTVIVDGMPVANDDSIEMLENTKVEGNVTVNDEGLCDKSINVSVHTAPEFGSLTIGNDGKYTYKPQNDYYGKDRFTYQLCDLDGDCDLATVEIRINSANEIPQANADNEQLQVDVIHSGNVAENDVTSGDGNNVWTLLNPPSNGTISFTPDGTYTYTPVTGFIGSDRFTYQLCDENGDCSQANVTISIEDVLLPNQILTPNDDGINDQFIINGIEYYPVNKVIVYNRWGNVVYQKNNYQNEWDGVSNLNKVGSKPLPVGTYYYLIDYGNNRHKTGYVYLDR